MFLGISLSLQSNLHRWRIFVDYLSSTASGGFNQSALTQKLSDFELNWQLGTWGLNSGEAWSATGNLWDILGEIKEKWGDLFSTATDRY
jgi:hypothetical protein